MFVLASGVKGRCAVSGRIGSCETAGAEAYHIGDVEICRGYPFSWASGLFLVGLDGFASAWQVMKTNDHHSNDSIDNSSNSLVTIKMVTAHC